MCYFKLPALCEIFTLSLHDALPISTLDEVTDTWPRVDFVKIDAEGSEEAIWRGMECLLARNADVTVVMELKPSGDRKSTRLNSSHITRSYAVFCLKKKICLNHMY